MGPLIDPFLDENPGSDVRSSDLERVDLILVTHAAFDHLGDTEADDVFGRHRRDVVLRGLAFIGDALAHGVLPGIAGAILLGLPGIGGAIVGAAVMIAGVSVVRRRSEQVHGVAPAASHLVRSIRRS